MLDLKNKNEIRNLLKNRPLSNMILVTKIVIQPKVVVSEALSVIGESRLDMRTPLKSFLNFGTSQKFHYIKKFYLKSIN